MTRHRTCQPFDHHQRNGTFLRVLIGTPADTEFELTIDEDLAIGTTRIIVLAATTLAILDEHTARLQTAARTVEWSLKSADGLHRRIINQLHPTTTDRHQ